MCIGDNAGDNNDYGSDNDNVHNGNIIGRVFLVSDASHSFRWLSVCRRKGSPYSNPENGGTLFSEALMII